MKIKDLKLTLPSQIVESGTNYNHYRNQMNLILEQKPVITSQDRDLLIIEDDDMVRRILERITKNIFRSIRAVANLEDAEKAITQLSPHGIILSDLELKSGKIRDEGLYLAQITLATRQELHQLFLLQSGNTEKSKLEIIQKAQESGMIDGFISKPFSPSDLRKKLHEVINKSAQFPDSQQSCSAD